jgi:hypothetical protein
MRDTNWALRSRRFVAGVREQWLMPWMPPFFSVDDRERIRVGQEADRARGVEPATRHDAVVERYLSWRADEFRAFFGDGWNVDESDEAYARRLAERRAAEKRAWIEHMAAGCPRVKMRAVPPRRPPPEEAADGRGALGDSADSAEP